MTFTWKTRPVTNIGDLIDALVNLTDQADGAAFMAAYAASLASTTVGHLTPDQARENAIANVGYCARYCDDDTYNRIIRLTGARHPLFGGTGTND